MRQMSDEGLAQNDTVTEGHELLACSAAIFDLDGTLIHSEHAWEAAKIEVLERHGITPARALLDAYVGQGLSGFLDAAFDNQLSHTARTGIANEIGAKADVLLPKMREPIAGAAHFLSALHNAGLRIAICSSSPRRHITGALEMLEVSDRVELIVSGADLPRGKPDPLPYATTLNELDLEPHLVCAFEDSRSGVSSALGAGLLTVAVGPGCKGPDFADCHYQAHSFGDLAALIPDFGMASI